MNHLQRVILDIAKDVDELFTANGIPYFLDGGTALGAVRHGGFIPWDDDFDIILLPEDYQRFVEVCRTQLDTSKYTFIEAEKDWPMHISKIKLKGTKIEEVDEYPMDEKGIYIDIFCFDYASDNKIGRYLQWIITRLWVVMMIATKPYTTLSVKKKIALAMARPLSTPGIRKCLRNLGRSKKRTAHLSMAWCRTRSKWERYFCDREIFERSRPIVFEDREFPVAWKVEDYLKICFGDYMKLPPKEKQVGLHVLNVDFGKYDDGFDSRCI